MTMGSMLMIGCGRMGGALLMQWLAKDVWPGSITVVKPTPALPEPLSADLRVHRIAAIESRSDEAPSLVVLAVKPQQMPAILADCARLLPANTLYITIAAGLPLTRYRQALGPKARLIRAMPNSPARIGMAMTLLVAEPGADHKDIALVETLMRAAGEVAWFSEESLIDVGTAVSGSGPAYVFYFMECLVGAAVDLGLDAKTARLLVAQTLLGSSMMAAGTEESLADLRSEVTSRGGTTEAALEHLMKPDILRNPMRKALAAALQRAKILAASA